MLSHAMKDILELTLAILMDFCREDWGDLVDWSLPKRGMGREISKAVEILSSLGSGHTPSLHPAAAAAAALQIVDRRFRRCLSDALGPSAAKAVRDRTRPWQNPLPSTT